MRKGPLSSFENGRKEWMNGYKCNEEDRILECGWDHVHDREYDY